MHTHTHIHPNTRTNRDSKGTDRGDVILFEPATTEHKSVRTIYDPVTAIAPAGDCHTYAIGYNNGSIFIANVVPTFTILHTISTEITPSPILGLAWHASSSKSKSDMLAIQSASGDLRVWNVAKPASADTPKPIRALERGGNGDIGINWIAWSKNGRIIQYSRGYVILWYPFFSHISKNLTKKKQRDPSMGCSNETSRIRTSSCRRNHSRSFKLWSISSSLHNKSRVQYTTIRPYSSTARRFTSHVYAYKIRKT